MDRPPVVCAYVVLSHSPAERLHRLVGAIRRSSPDSWILVMHDARRVSVPVIDDPRVEVRAHGLATDWGSWALVEATLDGFRRAREAVDPDLVVLVSGQCHPTRHLAEWERDLVASGGWQGEARAIAYRPRWGRSPGEGQDTTTRYSYRWYRAGLVDPVLRRKGQAARVLWAIAHRTEPLVSLRLVERGAGAHVGLRRLRPPFTPGRPCLLGSQWLAVDRVGLEQVLTELAPGAPLEKVYRRSIIPDESALQTVLGRHRDPVDPRTVSHRVGDRLPDGRPAASAAEQLAEIEGSGSPFCRKVEDLDGLQVLDHLDRVNGAV
jgi:hypothetical protein